jgi:hypothetical protein
MDSEKSCVIVRPRPNVGQLSTQKPHLRILQCLELAERLPNQRRDVLVEFAVLGQLLTLGDFEQRKKRLHIANALRFIGDFLDAGGRGFYGVDDVHRLVTQVPKQRILFSLLPQLLSTARDHKQKKNFQF